MEILFLLSNKGLRIRLIKVSSSEDPDSIFFLRIHFFQRTWIKYKRVRNIYLGDNYRAEVEAKVEEPMRLFGVV